MTGGDSVQRVRIYLNERDTHEGQALYLALLERLRREGATGATALRGAAGFGPGHRAKAVGFLNVSETSPIVVEWVDRVERIAHVMPLIDDLLGEALVTVEDVLAYRARLRSTGPFGGQTVGDVMWRDLAPLLPATSIRDAVRHMLERQHSCIAVMDERARPVALLFSTELERLAGLPLPLRLIHTLPKAERDELLVTLSDAPLKSIVAGEPRTAYIQSGIAQAAGTMLEWGLEALPVIDRDARLVGVIGVEQALRGTLAQPAPDETRIRDAEPSPPVRLLMQTSVPTASSATPATTALRQLLNTPDRFLVVVDTGQPVGMLDDASVARRLADTARHAWLRAARNPTSTESIDGIAPDAAIAALVEPVATINELATQQDAIAHMLERHLERLVVVDDKNRLVGLVGRRGLLRALAQESMG